MELKKIDQNTWEIPKSGAMKVNGIIYASEKLLEKIKQDKTVEQASNVACLKGIQRASYVMPDAHQGYGFPIGGVAAFDLDEGIISPGGVGYDIDCSVRLLRTELSVDEFMKKRKELIEELFSNVPAGVGKGGKIDVSRDELREALQKGARWAVSSGYGVKDDYEHTEEYGKLDADPSLISDRAMKRGLPQLGSLGAGNHFLEIQKIDRIFDDSIAKAFRLDNTDNVTVMIHCGSRGLGHQVASDYIKAMEDKYGHEGLPDRELINAPINSDLGQQYLKAMGAAANFAFANKQMITHWVRESFNKVFGDTEISTVYEVCHNIAKIEKHKLDGSMKELCVHRKGATRSFGPGRDEIPEAYRSVGQPVLIPGSMGTASYVLVGTSKAEEVSFGSAPHGAGRVASRHEALKRFQGESVSRDLAERGIDVKAKSWKSIAEEAPGVYKDIDEVIRVSHEAGIGNPVVRVVPLSVMKG
ncbi:RNA-splicing ligase RtcB [Candidatus Woesearchaeota archaeon]|nr:RNA-splicing ligase RtcB [Candidatus Woesearchaeota archaeon]